MYMEMIYGVALPSIWRFLELVWRRGQIIRIPEGIDFDEIIIVELLASVIKAQDQLRVGPW